MISAYGFAEGYTASEFVYKYKDRFSSGQIVDVLVEVNGEPSTEDPAKRAREIRYYQSGVLKFIHFAGAKNVISDTEQNQFTATMTMPLAEHVATRYDVTSVTILATNQEIRAINCDVIAPGKDLSGCDLYGVIFGDNLRGVNFTNTNLRGADFQWADLSGVDFTGAYLKSALLNNANLTNTDFSFSKVIRAEVTNSDLTGADFSYSTLYRTDFTNSDLTNVDFRYSILTYAILANTNLEGINFEKSGTWATNLNGCYNHEICE